MSRRRTPGLWWRRPGQGCGGGGLLGCCALSIAKASLDAKSERERLNRTGRVVNLPLPWGPPAAPPSFPTKEGLSRIEMCALQAELRPLLRGLAGTAWGSGHL